MFCYNQVTIFENVNDIFSIVMIDNEILGWCPTGPVLPHGEKVPL